MRPESRGTGASPETPARRSTLSKAVRSPPVAAQEFGAESDAESGHAQDDLGVAVAAKSVLDHLFGVGDFGFDSHHLLGQPRHHRRGDLLSGHGGVLGVGGLDRGGCDGSGVVGLAFTQPGFQPGGTSAAQPVGGLIAGEQDQGGLAVAVVEGSL